MKHTTLTLALYLALCVPTFGSAMEAPKPEAVEPGSLLPKSVAVQRAFIQFEEDNLGYLRQIHRHVILGGSGLDKSDPVQKELARHFTGDYSSHACVEKWVANSIILTQNNIVEIGKILALTSDVKSIEKAYDYFFDISEIYNNYIGSRYRAIVNGDDVPTTEPGKLSSLTALNRHVAEAAINRHACFALALKESYKILLKNSPEKAGECMLTVGPDTLMGQYLRKPRSELPDPQSCLIADGKLTDRTGKERSVRDHVMLLERTAQHSHLTRKDRRAADRAASKAQKKQDATSRRVTAAAPAPSAIATIRAAVTHDQETAARLEAEKALRVRAAQDAREAFLRLREAYIATGGAQEGVVEGATSSSASSTWTAPTPRVRKKTRRAPGVAYTRASSSSRSSSSSSASSSSQTDGRFAPTTGIMKRLEAFWDAKAGLTYHEVASLFTSLGGRIGEKSGGSSHVTLSYMAGDGTKLKHELWRPHGSGNTFGFRTVESLHRYFERCGLTLKD